MNLEELGLPLGQIVAQPDDYSADHLAPVPRDWAREKERVDAAVMDGVDVWNLWELSWLDFDGKPIQATGQFFVPHSSPNLVESKSIKLYFNSMNNHRLGGDWLAVQSRIAADLSAKAGAPVRVELTAVDQGVLGGVTAIAGECIDQAGWIDGYRLGADIAQGEPETVTLYSDAFRSLCPVTAQPDWATVIIDYQGPRLDRAKLASYLGSFRNHQGFHEACCERILGELLAITGATKLSVQACFLRRGGIDINPYRSTAFCEVPVRRLSRQ